MPENKMTSENFDHTLGALPDQKITNVPGPMDPMSESSKQLMAEHKQGWEEQSENIPQLVQSGQEITNLLGEDEEAQRQQQELEAYAVNERLEWGWSNAKRDRDMWVLDHATTPQEIAPIIKTLRNLEDWNRKEATNTYGYQNLIEHAYSNYDSYSMSYEELVDEGVVMPGDPSNGEVIDENGFIVNGELTEVGLAHVVKIFKETVIKETTIEHPEYEKDPETGKRKSEKPTRLWDEVVRRMETVEKPSFLSEKKRAALAEACRQVANQLLIGQKQHVETEVFDAQRAALEEQVKIFFFKQIGMGNMQFAEFFTAADIKKITPENLKNVELGEMRDRIMHIQRLIGQSETKEKLEYYLNNTFVLEQILDEKTLDLIIKTQNFSIKKIESESDSQFFERKYLAVARFLISKNLEIKTVDRRTRDGGTIKVKQYELKGWLTAGERDVCTNVFQGEEHKIYHSEKGAKGKDAIAFENEMGLRGVLVRNGNTFSRGEMDLQYAMNNVIASLMGDKKGYVTRDADRFMWTRGLKDEMGAEIYAFKYKADKDQKDGFARDDKGQLIPELDEDGYMIPNLPTGEDLVEAFNLCKTEQEWKDKMSPVLDRFSLPGEPVGSDLSKIIWAYLYSLKDQINERPTGLLLGVDKMPRMAQSLLSLGRTIVDTGFINKDGSITTEKSFRSLLEQWDGYKGSDKLVVELPKKLGEMAWTQTKSIEDLDRELRDELAKDIKEVLEADKYKKAVSDTLFKIMDVNDEEKGKLIDKYGTEEKALAAVIAKYFDPNTGGISNNLDGFYKLMNFLAGDGNPAKRPHAYFTDTKIDPKELSTLDYWTGKKKFLQIIFGAAGAFGDFRKFDIRAVKQAKDTSELSFKKRKKLITTAMDANVSKTQKGWMDTVRSSPMYATIRSAPVEYIKYENGQMVNSSMKLSQVVEGLSADKPGLAVRYGFMDVDGVGKAPKHQMKVLY